MQYKVFGCKVNKYYTDKWLNSEYLRDKTGTFVASCVVTDNAKRKWIRFVKKELEHLIWDDKIYISWCGAFKDGKAQNNFFELYPELAHAQNKIEVLDEAPVENQKVSPKSSQPPHSWILSPWEDKWETDLPLGKNWIRALNKLKTLQNTQIYTKKFVLIQGGCDSFCTFCLTVQKRGRHYYRAAEDIVEEIKDFEAQWGKEVVLTGVNLSAWGLSNTFRVKDFSQDIEKKGEKWQGSRFAELLQYILDHTSIPRVRISSLGPEFIDDACLRVFENTRIYPHFHFSIQSGSSQVLKAMARHYDGEYMRKLLGKMRNIPRKDGVSISLWADIIVWFPGENEEDFMDTYNLVKEYNITKVHAFPFSPHTLGESVPAGAFKQQVSENIKKDRMQRLTKLADTIREKFKASQKGKILHVLVEKAGKTSWSGWTENYLEANETNFQILAGIPQRNTIITGTFI